MWRRLTLTTASVAILAQGLEKHVFTMPRKYGAGAELSLSQIPPGAATAVRKKVVLCIEAGLLPTSTRPNWDHKGCKFQLLEWLGDAALHSYLTQQIFELLGPAGVGEGAMSSVRSTCCGTQCLARVFRSLSLSSLLQHDKKSPNYLVDHKRSADVIEAILGELFEAEKAWHQESANAVTPSDAAVPNIARAALLSLLDLVFRAGMAETPQRYRPATTKVLFLHVECVPEEPEEPDQLAVLENESSHPEAVENIESIISDTTHIESIVIEGEASEYNTELGERVYADGALTTSLQLSLDASVLAWQSPLPESESDTVDGREIALTALECDSEHFASQSAGDKSNSARGLKQKHMNLKKWTLTTSGSRSQATCACTGHARRTCDPFLEPDVCACSSQAAWKSLLRTLRFLILSFSRTCSPYFCGKSPQ